MSDKTKIQDTQYDAAIVGGGVIGLSLALGLAKNNAWKIALVEKGLKPVLSIPAPTEPGIRATAMGLPSVELLESLGIWQALTESQRCAYKAMYVWDENSQGELFFTADDYAVNELGFIVDHNALHECLSVVVDGQGLIDQFYETEIKSLQSSDGCVQLTISSSESLVKNTSEQTASKQTISKRIKANWVFAADGSDSSVRQLAGFNVSQHDYHQLGLVCKIQTQFPHQQTAWQCFKTSGPLALLPLSNGECSIVWSLGTTDARAMQQLSNDDFAARIKAGIQSRLGQVEISSDRFAFPLRSIRSSQYVKERVVLLGDAAHSVHPMSGQGANLGFMDVSVLLDELDGLSADDLLIPRRLRAYERKQKLNNQRLDTFQTNLDRLFGYHAPLINSIRGLGLGLINRQGALKSFFAQQVLGKS